MAIAPSLKSPIETLADLLNATPALRGWAKVLAGKNALAATRAPPSVVIFPVTAGYVDAADNVASMIDVDLKVYARLWGNSLSQAWELRQRFIQALRQQATGPDGEFSAPADAGYYYTLLKEDWDVSADTSAQGQEMEVVFTARFEGAPTTNFGTGEILATSLDRVLTVLTAPLGATAAAAFVADTSSFAASGNVSIGGEQISYTGLTATSLTGLTRGIHGTTAAAHDPRDLVTPIP